MYFVRYNVIIFGVVLSTLFYVADILLRIKCFSKLFPSISYKFSFYLRTYYQYNYIMYLCTQHSKILIRYPIIYKFNPLWTKFFFSSFFGTYHKIGSFRLPTHRRDAHMKFFWWFLLKIELKFRWKGTPVSSWALKG